MTSVANEAEAPSCVDLQFEGAVALLTFASIVPVLFNAMRSPPSKPAPTIVIWLFSVEVAPAVVS